MLSPNVPFPPNQLPSMMHMAGQFRAQSPHGASASVRPFPLPPQTYVRERAPAGSTSQAPLPGDMHYLSSTDLVAMIGQLSDGAEAGLTLQTWTPGAVSELLASSPTIRPSGQLPAQQHLMYPVSVCTMPLCVLPRGTQLSPHAAANAAPPVFSFLPPALSIAGGPGPATKKLLPPASEAEAIRQLEQIASRQAANFSLGGSSKFRGVHWTDRGNAWRAKIKSGDRTWYLGLYASEVLAAQAYDAGAWFVFGPKAMINFPCVAAPAARPNPPPAPSEFDYNLFEPPRPPPPWLLKRLLDKVHNGAVLSGPAVRYFAKNPFTEPQVACTADSKKGRASEGEEESEQEQKMG
jgi:hypothetical protein